MSNLETKPDVDLFIGFGSMANNRRKREIPASGARWNRKRNHLWHRLESWHIA